MSKFSKWLITILVISTLLVGFCTSDMCDRRDMRQRRNSHSWKGDIGHMNDKLHYPPHRRRVRRFLSFPTGSMMTITPDLTIPWLSELNGDLTSDQVYKFPIDLALPNATLRFTKFNSDDDSMMYGYGGKHDIFHEGDTEWVENHQQQHQWDNQQQQYEWHNSQQQQQEWHNHQQQQPEGHNHQQQQPEWHNHQQQHDWNTHHNPESGYSQGYYDLQYLYTNPTNSEKYDHPHADDYDRWGTYDEHHSSYSSYSDYDTHQDYWKRKRRDLDDQRIKGFKLLEQALESVGLDGRECVLRAVCEIGEEPVSDLGIIGEIINLFFSPGYGDRVDELLTYIVAEESGRAYGDCESLYQRCPYKIASMAQSAFGYFHQGLAHVGHVNSHTLTSS